MSEARITKLKSFDDYNMQFTSHKYNKIGVGSEGACYLKNGKVYKVLDPENDNEINTNTVVTSNMLKSKHVIFPDELFVVKDKLVGYTSKYIPNDILLCDPTAQPITFKKSLARIDFDKLQAAYHDFIENDIREVSGNKIDMYDLCNNLMFNGEDLYAIDTCSFEKKASFNTEELIDRNISSLNYALTVELDNLVEFSGEDYRQREVDNFKAYINKTNYHKVYKKTK
jgi:hypothetical protein